MEASVIQFYLDLVAQVAADIGKDEQFGDYFKRKAREANPMEYGPTLGCIVLARLSQYKTALYVRDHADPSTITLRELSNVDMDLRYKTLRDVA